MKTLRQIIASTFLLPCIFAQVPDIPAAPAKTESHQETIARNLKDFESEDVEVRKRAIMLLGKYDQPAAREASRKALRDQSALIRRTALVALLDRQVAPPPPKLPKGMSQQMLRSFGGSSAGAFLNEEDVIAILRLAGDEELSIRRISTSHLQQLLRFSALSPPLPPDIRQVLAAAASDSDAIVRRNIANSLGVLRGIITNDMILKLMEDPDRDVRAAAMINGWVLLGMMRFAEVAPKLAEDNDVKIRLQLTKLLSRYCTMNIETLSMLAEDENFEISCEALIGLLGTANPKYWPPVRERLDNPAMKSELGVQAIRMLRQLKEDGKPEIIKLMSHRNPAYRHAALQTFGFYFWDAKTPQVVFDRLEDASPLVRKEAGQILTRKRQAIPIKLLERLATSEYADLRMLALEFAGQIKIEAAESIVMDLFLDDDIEIRRHALLLIGVRRFPGWLDIMADSLEDDDVEIREQSVEILGRTKDRTGMLQPEVRNVLEEYLKSGSDAALKGAIRQVLAPRRRPALRPAMVPLRPAPAK